MTNIKDMKPKQCENCGENLFIHQWGEQDYEYSYTKKRWIAMYDYDFTYFCTNCKDDDSERPDD